MNYDNMHLGLFIMVHNMNINPTHETICIIKAHLHFYLRLHKSMCIINIHLNHSVRFVYNNILCIYTVSICCSHILNICSAVAKTSKKGNIQIYTINFSFLILSLWCDIYTFLLIIFIATTIIIIVTRSIQKEFFEHQTDSFA